MCQFVRKTNMLLSVWKMMPQSVTKVRGLSAEFQMTAMMTGDCKVSVTKCRTCFPKGEYQQISDAIWW